MSITKKLLQSPNLFFADFFFKRFNKGKGLKDTSISSTINRLFNDIQSLKKSIEKYESIITIQTEKLNEYEKKVDLLQGEISKTRKENQARYNTAMKEAKIKLFKYGNESIKREILGDWYYKATGNYIDFDNPKTFNEKIQWQKIYDNNQMKSDLSDKYAVREFVKERIGEQYLVPLLGVWNNFDEIDFSNLPDKFALKCNHGSGYNIIVKNKSNIDINKLRKTFNKWMNTDYSFQSGYELQYSTIKRRIIAEQFLSNRANSSENTSDLYDYKFWCFNGKVHYIQFVSGRSQNNIKMSFYDSDWNIQDFVFNHPLDPVGVEKPKSLQLMISLAEKLASGFPHVRVDFYQLNDGTVIFGEMTFSSMSGLHNWTYPEINYRLGSLLKLPFEG